METLQSKIDTLIKEKKFAEVYELIKTSLPKDIAKQYIQKLWQNSSTGFMHYVCTTMKDEYLENQYNKIISELGNNSTARTNSPFDVTVEEYTDTANKNLTNMYEKSSSFKALINSLTVTHKPYRKDEIHYITLHSWNDGGGAMSVGVYQTFNIKISDNKLSIRLSGYNGEDLGIEKYESDSRSIVRVLERPETTLDYLLSKKVSNIHSLVEV